MQDGIVKGGGVDTGDSKLKPFIDRVRYFATNFDDDEGFEKLKTFLEGIDKFNWARRGTVCSTSRWRRSTLRTLSERLSKHGMTKARGRYNWINVVIEKPFGTDLESAKKLNAEVNAVLKERQIFRIDHYLGKETVQNILVFRFGNALFEPVWNRNFIDHVEITAAESIGIEGRGPFYEAAGALRDVLQNHVMEVLSFVAMEPPDSFAAECRAHREAEGVACDSIDPSRWITPRADNMGQAKWMVRRSSAIGRKTACNAESQTETYAAMKLTIENWRWAGVPFYMRAGKRMAKRVTEVTMVFKQPPLHLFKSKDSDGKVHSNVTEDADSAGRGHFADLRRRKFRGRLRTLSACA